MPRLRRTRASAEHQPFSDSMTEQHSHGVAAGVPETDHDELLYRITADHEHPVMRYVRELPFESAVYPAIEYLRLHPQDGVGDESQEGTRDCHSEHLMQEGPRPHRQCKIRIYRECHRILRTFDGYHDCTGSYIRCIRDDPVVVFAEDFDLVRNIFQSFKSRLRDESLTIVTSPGCAL